MGVPDKGELLKIIRRHLETVKEYDPYANFPGTTNRSDFVAVIGNDPAFRFFGLANDKYAIARIGGNLITSLHRKLGDMYEDVFGYLLQKRFGIPIADLSFGVDVVIGERSQRRSTDGLLRRRYFADLRLPALGNEWPKANGLAFEVRSCYQIGDSKRIQADYDMALALDDQSIVPVMLIFCKTSLRSPVTRLKKSWRLFEGDATFEFIKQLTNFDLAGFLQLNEAEISRPVKDVLANL